MADTYVRTTKSGTRTGSEYKATWGGAQAARKAITAEVTGKQKGDVYLGKLDRETGELGSIKHYTGRKVRQVKEGPHGQMYRPVVKYMGVVKQRPIKM